MGRLSKAEHVTETFIEALHRGKPARVPIAQVTHFVAEDKYTTAYTDKGELLLRTPLNRLESIYGERVVRRSRSLLVVREHLAKVPVPEPRVRGQAYQIAKRWGMPFWDLVRDLAAQGLSRGDAARAMGFNDPNTLFALLHRFEQHDPFPVLISIPAQYTRDTGESFRAACLRMAKTHTITEATHAIGYVDPSSLRAAMRSRGIEVQFQRKPRQRTSK